MIYERMLVKEKCLIDLNVTFKESVTMIDYLEESCFLTESANEKTMNDIIAQMKRLTSRINNKTIEGDELKEEVEDLYEKLKSIGNVEALKQEGKWYNNKFLLWVESFISFILSYSFFNAGATVPGMIALVISLFTGMLSSIPTNNPYYDQVYDLLVRSESKFMMEKRKAIKNNDKDAEKIADQVIEIIENFKTKRRMEYKKQKTNESTIINESDKSEIKINNFKQTVDEIDRYLKLSFEWLKVLCDTTRTMIKKANKINKSNANKTCNEIIEIGEKANDELDKLEPINVPLADALFRKWGNTFSSKYSPYGMEVREKFEKKLAEFNDEVIDYLNKFYDEISIEVMGVKGKSIGKISDELYKNMRSNGDSIAVADKINSTIASWYNGHLKEYKFITNEIAWANSVMKSAKIKNTLRYKIFSKIVK